MGYAKLDDRLPHHHKVRAIATKLALAAYGLYVASVQFAQRDETDGRIHEADLLVIMPTAPRPQLRTLAGELVRVHLWDPRDDGWVIHDYLDHNLSAAERRVGTLANRRRQAQHRERLRNAVTGEESNVVTNALPDDVTNALPGPWCHASSNASTNAFVTGPTPLLSSKERNSPPTSPQPANQPGPTGDAHRIEGRTRPEPEGLAALHAQEAQVARERFQQLVAGVSERIGFKLDAP